MAPVSLQPHSCQYCAKIVLDEAARPTSSDRGEEKNFFHFDFFTPDILAGALDGCSLCEWLLDEEWIHRDATVKEVLSRTHHAPGTSGYGVVAAVAEASIRQNEWMPPRHPTNTLRSMLSQDGDVPRGNLRLACFLHDFEIRFFGLWDPSRHHMVHRTRHGFSVFTEPGKYPLRLLPPFSFSLIARGRYK